MRRKQDKLISLTKFVKRFYVLQMKDALGNQTLMYFKSQKDWQTNSKPCGIVQLPVSQSDSV